MIEVKNLVKDYGGHVAVDHLNFTVEDGFIYGFLGPNGAGKSTTMNMMTGYLGATEGEIIIEGNNILEEPKKAKQCIGYLPEIPPLYVDMTVTEYLEFAAALKDIPRKERKAEIERAVEVTKLTDVSHRLIRNLSKGYKQRVGLAQAILGMPPVIILDEPTVGLDPKQIIEIRDLIKELGKQHTVILSSHILSEVQAVCDKIMIISHGRLVASDTPENLEKMAGTYGMELMVKTDETTAAEILAKTDAADWIRDIVIRQNEETGETAVSFQFDNDGSYEHDIRETIFFAFAEERVPILAMKEKKMSLEDVFLELTGDKKNTDADNSDVDDAETGMAGEAEAAEAVEAAEMVLEAVSEVVESEKADDVETNGDLEVREVEAAKIKKIEENANAGSKTDLKTDPETNLETNPKTDPKTDPEEEEENHDSNL